jgi:hypothetical protein
MLTAIAHLCLVCQHVLMCWHDPSDGTGLQVTPHIFISATVHEIYAFNSYIPYANGMIFYLYFPMCWSCGVSAN